MYICTKQVVMRKYKSLDKIDYSIYDFDAENGKIWSKSKKEWLSGRKQKINGNDDDYYLIVCLKNIDGTKDFYLYHRVLAYKFIEVPNELRGIPYEELEINHKNEIKYDNRIVNLEWCSRPYNVNYGNGNKKRSDTNKKIKHSEEWNEKVSNSLTKDAIIRVMDNGDVIEYKNISDAAKLTNSSKGAICRCCNNKFHKEKDKNYKSFRRYKKSEWYYKNDYKQEEA